MSAILPIIIFIAIFAGAIFLGLRASKQRVEASWSGEVIDKSVDENVERNDQFNNNDNRPINIGFGVGTNNAQIQPVVTHSYRVTIKTDDGKEIFWSVSSGMYEQIKIGDRMVKKSGEATPQIIPAQLLAQQQMSQAQPAPSNAPANNPQTTTSPSIETEPFQKSTTTTPPADQNPTNPSNPV